MRTPLLWITLFFSLTATRLFSQTDGYAVRFRVNGLKDTTCLIANYYGNGTYVKDTVKVDGTGRTLFKAGPDLPKGVYIFVVTDKKYFEFIINNDHKFSMETELSDPAGKMTVTGSPENTLFYEYMAYNRKKYEEMQDLQAALKQHEANKDSADMLKKKILEINDETIRYKLNIVKEHPDSFLAFLINAMKEPEIPEAPLLPDGSKDSTFAYRYFKEHFWDDVDFTDDRLLRTPVFHNKLKRYFDQVVVQTPDSIIPEIDRLANKARPNPEMFKYIVWFATYHYENSEIMGFDRIFVHVVDTYYVTGQATWVQKDVAQNLIKKAEKLKPLLIGNVAPNMIMLDTNNQLVSMHNIMSNYLILLFWDPDCGHCLTEIPKIKEFVDQYKDTYGIQVFAVCSDTSLVKWKTEIRKRGMNWINVDGPRSLSGNYKETYDIVVTPVVFILNSKKEIIAKQLKTEQFGAFFRNYSASQGKR